MNDDEDNILVVEAALPRDLCRDLVTLHDVCGTRGYRLHTEATQLSALLASQPQLALPLLKARDIVRDTVFNSKYFKEEDKYYFFEFTGLLVWCKGSSIKWHLDNNRKYLEQRKISIVCYLSTQGLDFEGGALHFKQGRDIKPTAGKLVAYPSGKEHCVDEVTLGRRYSLQVWLTDQAEFSEDKKLVMNQFAASGLPRSEGLPDEMFKLDTGEDRRLTKLAELASQSDFEFEEIAGKAYLLKSGSRRVKCANLSEALHLAILISSSNICPADYDLERAQQVLSVHNEKLYELTNECFLHSLRMGMGELYITDEDKYKASLLPEL